MYHADLHGLKRTQKIHNDDTYKAVLKLYLYKFNIENIKYISVVIEYNGLLKIITATAKIATRRVLKTNRDTRNVTHGVTLTSLVSFAVSLLQGCWSHALLNVLFWQNVLYTCNGNCQGEYNCDNRLIKYVTTSLGLVYGWGRPPPTACHSQQSSAWMSLQSVPLLWNLSKVLLACTLQSFTLFHFFSFGYVLVDVINGFSPTQESARALSSWGWFSPSRLHFCNADTVYFKWILQPLDPPSWTMLIPSLCYPFLGITHRSPWFTTSG